jgi:hypothetical protein
MSRVRLETLGDGLGPLVLHPLLALLSFPTLGRLVASEDGRAYAHDVSDLPRSGVLWLVDRGQARSLEAQFATTGTADGRPTFTYVGLVVAAVAVGLSQLWAAWTRRGDRA